VVAYVAAVGLGPDDLTGVLDKFAELGTETVFTIRGDAPAGDESFKAHPDALPHASDLLSFIKSRYDFCLGAAGYPEGHLEAESLEKDIEYVKLKQDCGAEYIVAQYFYDNQFFYNFVDRCRGAGVTVPIIPGIMPIYTAKMTEILSKVCGSTLTDEVRQGIACVSPDDKEGVARFGIDFATQQCRDLLKNGVQGLHFYTMNRGKSVQAILNNLASEGLV
jgi:methylenetetrahydrofolate reductase (NADPH)